MKQGWEIKKLGQVCDFQNGFAFKSNTYKETGLPILRITNIQNQSLEINELVYFDAKDYKENFDRFKVVKDDLVVAMSGATTGKLGINTTDTVFYLNQRVGKFIPKKEILKPYLYYFLSTKVEESLRIAAGAAQPNLSTEQINNFEIPLPTLPEQQRIVSILDEAFAAIAKAKANAEQNLKNAKELFESYLQGVFENKGEGWEENKLGEVCNIGDGNYSSKYPKASEFVQSGVPFLTATNLKNGTVIPDGIRFISKEQHLTLTKGHIIQGDLVIVVRGSSTGNNSIVPIAYAGSNLNSQLAFLRVKDKTYLDSDYLFAVFNSPLVMKKVKAEISGAAQPQLPNNKLLDISINIPSLKDQQTIVRQLDALRAETQKLEAVYQKKIADLEELKKSVLQKAFAGELKTEKAVEH